MLTRIFGGRRDAPQEQPQLGSTRNVTQPAREPVVVRPLFPQRDPLLARAFAGYRVRTAHGTVLATAPDTDTLCHRPPGAPGEDALLFHALHMPTVALLVSSHELRLEAGPSSRILPFLVVGDPASGAFVLRSPVKEVYLCAVAPQDEVGGTDFYRSWMGPWEHFRAETLTTPVLDADLEQALQQIALLIGTQLDAASVAAWSASAADAERRLALPALLHLLARDDLASLTAARLEASSHDLQRLAVPPPASMPPRPGPMSLVERIDRHAATFSPQRLGSGWHIDVKGRCGPAAARASVAFTLPCRPRHAKLKLDIHGTEIFRLVTVSVNGWCIGKLGIGATKLGGSFLECWIPGEALSSPELLVTFDVVPQPSPELLAFHLGAMSLEAGPAVAALAGPDLANPDLANPGRDAPAAFGPLMSAFESLGDDCEFGFVQRHFGIEPLGIFRFAGAGDLSNLLYLLSIDLKGLGDPGSLAANHSNARIYRPGEPDLIIDEFLMHDPKLRFGYHTWRGPADAPEAVARQENEQKLRYLRRKFLEDLEDGEKIWLLKDATRQDLHEAFAFHAVLNRRGRNKLFWITRTIEGRPAGSVEWIGPDLLRGYSDQPHGDAQRFWPDSWLELCRNAWRAFAERAG